MLAYDCNDTSPISSGISASMTATTKCSPIQMRAAVATKKRPAPLRGRVRGNFPAGLRPWCVSSCWKVSAVRLSTRAPYALLSLSAYRSIDKARLAGATAAKRTCCLGQAGAPGLPSEPALSGAQRASLNVTSAAWGLWDHSRALKV